MQINRRIARLEAVLPENVTSYRVLFKNDGEPAPVIDPPLGPNEQVIMTTFVQAKRRVLSAGECL